MFCHFHEKRLTPDVCSLCGIPVCTECEVILKGKIFCQSCVQQPLPGIKFYPPRNPFLAALFSFFLPGLGQVYNGQVEKGVAIFFTCWLVIPWLYGVYDAYRMAKKINNRQLLIAPSKTYFVFCFILFSAIFFMVFHALEENILSPRQEILVKESLTKLSRTLENYAQKHGKYPKDFSQFYFTSFSGMEDLYCDTENFDYHYSCSFNEEGYTVTAKPLATLWKKLPAYTITKGGVLTSSDDKAGK
jgi:hypothetical protein